MIALLLSQRLEDKNRDKGKKKVAFVPGEQNTNIPPQKENWRSGPPPKGRRVTEASENYDRDKDKTEIIESSKEAFLRSRSLPYVEIPPLKATLRTPEKETANNDQNTKIGPAYKSQAPVEHGVDIEKLVENVLDLEISVPLRSLAGVSGAIQKEIRKQVTKARIPIETMVEKKASLLTESLPQNRKPHIMKIASYMVIAGQTNELPEGHMVANDPVLQFLSETKNEKPAKLITAKSSENLRAIYMTINRVGQEECLLDDGSQIVSMGKEIAVKLGLTWDPSLVVEMESSTSNREFTLGLARNVCFRVGGLDLYLQVHILKNPPYTVLLGRPFSVFTACVSKTNLDGSSELVLTEPNSKQVASVPTYERGVGPEELLKQNLQDF